MTEVLQGPCHGNQQFLAAHTPLGDVARRLLLPARDVERALTRTPALRVALATVQARWNDHRAVLSFGLHVTRPPSGSRLGSRRQTKCVWFALLCCFVVGSVVAQAGVCKALAALMEGGDDPMINMAVYEKLDIVIFRQFVIKLHARLLRLSTIKRLNGLDGCARASSPVLFRPVPRPVFPHACPAGGTSRSQRAAGVTQMCDLAAATTTIRTPC